MGNKKQHISAVQIQRTEMTHIGPLPPPDILSQYDTIVPGAAERILQMAEKEQQHRFDCEKKVERSAIRVTFTGVIFAFLSVLIISSLVFFALYKGFDNTAGWIAVGAIAAVASVFIFFRKKKK
jgi:LPXTG-motif cell wall-anchored protein